MDSPLLTLPAIAIALFGVAALLVTYSAARAPRAELSRAASLPLEDGVAQTKASRSEDRDV